MARVHQFAERHRVILLHGLDCLQCALVFGYNVTGSAVYHAIQAMGFGHDLRATDVAQCRDTKEAGGQLALDPAFIVARFNQPSACVRVQYHHGGIGWQRHRPNVERATINQERMSRPT